LSTPATSARIVGAEASGSPLMRAMMVMVNGEA
jgi:hypothetical protein